MKKFGLILVVIACVLLSACCGQQKSATEIVKTPINSGIKMIGKQAEFLTAFIKPQVDAGKTLIGIPVKATQNIISGGAQFVFGLADGTNTLVNKSVAESTIPMVGEIDVYRVEDHPDEINTPLKAVTATADTLGALKLIGLATEPLKAFYDALPGDLVGVTYNITKESGVITAISIAGTIVQGGDMAIGSTVFTIKNLGEKIVTSTTHQLVK